MQSKSVDNDKNGMKMLFLTLLTLQGTVTALLTRYTMIRESEKYIKSTVVVLMEFIKVVTCIVVLFITQNGLKGFCNIIKKEILSQPQTVLMVSVPAFLYVIQNNLMLLGYSRLDVATFQVIYQLKILTTALFSVFLLQKVIKVHQWISLVILAIGVAVVSYSTVSSSAGKSNKEGLENHISKTDFMIGFASLVIASFTSGFSGVFFEKILKRSGFSLWILNLQLAFFGFILALFGCILSEFDMIKSKGFFVGYDWVIWVMVFLTAYGGFVISLVMKYADNILKSFSTSIAIVFSAICSYFLFGASLSCLFIVGMLLVISAVVLYSHV